MRGSFDPAPLNPDSEAGRSRLLLSAYLGFPDPPKFDINHTSLGPHPQATLDATVTPNLVRQALSQVNHMNFFYDVFEVELKRTWDLPLAILERLQPITGHAGNYFADPIPLNLATLRARATWLLAFRVILTTWPSSREKPRNFEVVPRETDSGINAQDVMALELALARFYCHAAQDILGRRPTIPLYR